MPREAQKGPILEAFGSGRALVVVMNTIEGTATRILSYSHAHTYNMYIETFPNQWIRCRVLYIVSRQVSGSQAPKSVAPTVDPQTVAPQTVAHHKK